MQIPQVDRKSVEDFSKIWTYNGVTILLNEMHVQFAQDFANQTLRSFVHTVAAQQAAAIKAQQAKNIIPSA